MNDRPWSRLRRKARDEPRAGAEGDDLHGDANAWWAEDETPVADATGGPRTAEELREAFRKKRRPPEPKRKVFEEYFSTESLFVHSSDTSSSQDEPFDPDDPYVVLGVAASASWDEITTAHRRLAKLHHPDRLLHATDDEREASDRRMRDVNIAYAELKRRRGK